MRFCFFCLFVSLVAMLRAVFLFALILVVACGNDNNIWNIGFSAQKISPEEGERCCLGGYGECLCTRQQTGVHDDVYARAFYMRIGMEELVFVSIDTVGMSNTFIDDCISNASDYIHDPTRIIMSSTHSHSSPDFAGIWGGVGKTYRSFVVSQVKEAIATAKKSAVPADLMVAKTEYGSTSNRRGWISTDYTVLALWFFFFFFSSSSSSFFLFLSPSSPHFLFLSLRATAKGSGDLIGLIVNFGAHPTILGSSNTQVSRDWVNGLIVTLEKSLGEDKAMYVNAAQVIYLLVGERNNQRKTDHHYFGFILSFLGRCFS